MTDLTVNTVCEFALSPPPLSSIFIEHKHRIYALARDVGNLSYKDKHFPVARHKDVYTGFSWASGIAPGLRQEESSSEVGITNSL